MHPVAPSDDLPLPVRLAFIGPMTGHLPGRVTTQGETLHKLFSEAGYAAILSSRLASRYLRPFDIVATLLRRRRQVDIQCLQVFGGPLFLVEDAASLIGRLLGQRIIMVLRGGAMPDFMARHPQWSRRVLARADAIVTPSNFLARAIRTHGYDALVIPNVIKLDEYPYRLRPAVAPRLFWMRAFHEIYNPMMAVRVLARLRESVPTATLVMGGQDKGLQEPARKLAEELGIAGAIEFVGYLDFSRKIALAGAADIYLNTNHVDNMPVTVVEMGAMGLPVVATNVGGIADLVTDGENALLVPDDDTEAMVGAIRRLLDEPDLARRLSTNGREVAERSSWKRVRRQWEELFETVTDGRKQSVKGAS